MTKFKRAASLLVAAMLFAALLGGCGKGGVKLDPKNPVTISVWHYYNGSIMNAFDAAVREFNETVGAKTGIIVEAFGKGSVAELEDAVLASARDEVGSEELPNIFASYADTAYAAEKLGILANLEDHLTKQEQGEYIDSYIEEGKIGLQNELRIFPIAKSTEVFMLNDTDWAPFAQANNLSYDDLATNEGLAAVAKLYYEWTDAQTPNVADDGKAFYGRDSMANMFIIASKELGVELFEVREGKVTINVDEAVMRKIWDFYYVSYISGYFSAFGKFRSDDAKVGDILSYVGSTSSASYFPSEVTIDGDSHAVEPKVLPVPRFEGAQRVIVQQGAGMVVTKGSAEEEYASAVFLKWFTDVETNSVFSALSGYMPVKKEANVFEDYTALISASGHDLSPITLETLRVSFSEIASSELYTSKAFDGGKQARSALDFSLADKCAADLASVLQLVADGVAREEAVARFNTDENFQEWLDNLSGRLNEAAPQG